MIPQFVYHTVNAVMGPFIRARSRSLQAPELPSGFLPISGQSQDLPAQHVLHFQYVIDLNKQCSLQQV